MYRKQIKIQYTGWEKNSNPGFVNKRITYLYDKNITSHLKQLEFFAMYADSYIHWTNKNATQRITLHFGTLDLCYHWRLFSSCTWIIILQF